MASLGSTKGMLEPVIGVLEGSGRVHLIGNGVHWHEIP
jgi:hypothetical protein